MKKNKIYIMNKKNLLIVFAFVLILLSSCTIKEQIATIKSGDNIDNLKLDPSGNPINLTENQTFATYKKGTNQIVEPSNKISFNLVKKEKSRFRFGWKKMKKGKKQYAFVAVNKYFYKFLWWRPIVGGLAIPLTYGTSLAYLPPTTNKKSLSTSEKIKDESLIDRTVYNKKILIETRIWCKRDVIKDSVILVENLPDEITIDNYTLKVKRGKKRIKDIEYKKKIIDGQTCHIFTFKATDGVFKKKNKIWLILDVTIKPEQKDLID